MNPYERLQSLGLALPAAPRPVATYVPFVLSGGMLFLSGQGPRDGQGGYATGQLGRDVSIDQGYAHARTTGLYLISVMEMALGDLRRVGRVVKVLGMVNATPDFTDHPKVINGCSDLFVEVFGEAGRHARSAVGMGSLPNGMTVEVEAIVEVAA
ncbi:RidA family protein [Alsobacter sp. SYSU M60028]|uniref:RidA family protein n=1 Tax=Alsobacter ponti TaxID=2962936 RepID=A0ABT1L9F8_9HYPH|nr:RidA family protein [Alsobacter ponti]